MEILLSMLAILGLMILGIILSHGFFDKYLNITNKNNGKTN